MKKNEETNFERSDVPNVPLGLQNKIIDCIRKEKKLRETKRRVVFFSLGLGLSLSAMVPAYNLVSGRILQTGFGNFISLVLSDYKIVADYWGTFTLALLESFPVAESIIFLTTIFFVLGFLRLLVKNTRMLLDQMDGKIRISIK